MSSGLGKVIDSEGRQTFIFASTKAVDQDQSFIDGVTHAHSKAPAAEQRFYIGLKLASQSVL